MSPLPRRHARGKTRRMIVHKRGSYIRRVSREKFSEFSEFANLKIRQRGEGGRIKKKRERREACVFSEGICFETATISRPRDFFSLGIGFRLADRQYRNGTSGCYFGFIRLRFEPANRCLSRGEAIYNIFQRNKSRIEIILLLYLVMFTSGMLRVRKPSVLSCFTVRAHAGGNRESYHIRLI